MRSFIRLVLIASLLSTSGCYLLQKNAPNCSDKNTLSLAREIVAEAALERPINREEKEAIENALSFEYPRATRLEENIKKYSCSAQLVIHRGAERKTVDITYTSQLSDDGDHIVGVGGGISSRQIEFIKKAIRSSEQKLRSETKNVLDSSQAESTPSSSNSNASSELSNRNNQVSSELLEMMSIYNNPETAPDIKGCEENTSCNAFMALSEKWQSIPDSYRYKGEYDIKSVARKGITYDDQGRNVGLERSFYFRTEDSVDLIDGANAYVETTGGLPRNYQGGLAVLLYIEDKNGLATE